MDKLQMSVTLSEPDLLAFLRQYSGARDRSFMLRMLALRGLQAGGVVGPDGRLWAPMAESSQPPLPAPPPSDAAVGAAQEERALEPSRPELVQSPAPLSTSATAGTSGQLLEQSRGTKAVDDGHSDPLGGLDLAALNEAMARY